MKKITIIASVVATVFAAGAAAGTGDLWGHAYADYKIKDSKNQTILGVEGGWSNSQGGAWAGLEQNVTDDAQWIGVGGHYNIHGDVALFGAAEFEYDESRDWGANMYKGGVKYSGFKSTEWSTSQYVGIKTWSESHEDRDTYAIMGVSGSYKLAQNFTAFASLDGSAKDDFLTEFDVGLKYTIPNIPGAYVAATYENDYQNSDLVDSWK
ncbi:MAG: hypothetical protein ACRC6V_17030, partial [Bacteroidales bacterium]